MGPLQRHVLSSTSSHTVIRAFSRPEAQFDFSPVARTWRRQITAPRGIRLASKPVQRLPSISQWADAVGDATMAPSPSPFSSGGAGNLRRAIACHCSADCTPSSSAATVAVTPPSSIFELAERTAMTAVRHCVLTVLPPELCSVGYDPYYPAWDMQLSQR